ncbi:4'-phosphopantetheinyl transferase superfamily protein [Dyella sp. GSA-30]|uniref:4'-phosphopantetheinyl transferase family protein n=1 Tax=Dyella sp. GSA-30 TaxID=2994496 RepID=UPI002492737B|nr:4'-phosphopantetheinyl transferase superfamily protein [Dyella sp. GSA-30]BDU21615.1 hypothetical protein DYGSA30_30720 [Dyella sp. GSA-30]
MDLDAAALSNDASGILLDERESTKMHAFVSPLHGRRFAVCRTALRRLLGSSAGIAADDVRIDYGEQGRPFLANPSGILDFNVAHCQNAAVIALSTSTNVGIDIERDEDGERIYAELAPIVLTSDERAALVRELPAQRGRAFFAYWTAKEAFMKLIGTGLSIDPSRIQVEWKKGYRQGRVRCCENPMPAASLFAVDVGADAICTLATAIDEVAVCRTMLEDATSGKIDLLARKY